MDRADGSRPIKGFGEGAESVEGGQFVLLSGRPARRRMIIAGSRNSFRPPEPVWAQRGASTENAVVSDFSVRSSIEGSYELIVRPFKRTLNRGEGFLIAVYVSGYGRLDGGKIVFFFPYGLLAPSTFPVVHPETPAAGSVEMGIALAKHSPTGAEVVAPASRNPLHVGSSTAPLSMTGNIIEFNRGFGFSDRPMAQAGYVPRVASEVEMENTPPILIRGKIYERGPPGDHDIPFVLTYVTGDKVKTSKSTLQMHVRHWWERPIFQLAVFAAAIATVAGIVLAVLHV